MSYAYLGNSDSQWLNEDNCKVVTDCPSCHLEDENIPSRVEASFSWNDPVTFSPTGVVCDGFKLPAVYTSDTEKVNTGVLGVYKLLYQPMDTVESNGLIRR